ncbi:potassium/sodium hyperpolarization-activated cyclic nucleotide-gated channel 2-like [Copidosoma floridanum]|uniref:potassium/sodium hyperpolarization-activated cyclic nucleotide-gated channel 2-like n=1 Tax=Copidosoma floridanum TaxID=29053 RepID=UPI000C6F9154|nr:potassium/sodium hyperpolarization-activated cyclic nucleotide-gated channel 2-like [Copidosoma floridanum]
MRLLSTARPGWHRKSDRHLCELIHGSESQLPRLPPNAAYRARFKRRLQKVLIVWNDHPQARIYLRSKAALAFEKRRHGISAHWWVAHPCSKFRFFWDVVMTFTYLYMFTVIPFTRNFYRLPNKGLSSASETAAKLSMSGYIICLADVFMNCITGYISEDGHEIFIDPVRILRLNVSLQLTGSDMRLLSTARPGWHRKSDRHLCELIHGSESQLPRLPPNAAYRARFKRRLQKVLIVWNDHPQARIYLRSKAALAFEKRRHGISAHWWVAHPCSKFRFFWDVVMTFTYLYMFTVIPFTRNFYRLPNKGLSSASETAAKLSMSGYIICLADVFMNCITGYISEDGHEIFIDPVRILRSVRSPNFRHYMRRLFIIDLLSSIPYTWFSQGRPEEPGPDVNLYFLVLEVLPLLKFFRLPTLRRYVKQIVVVCGASRVYQQSLWILIMTILIFHLAACFTYAVPIFYAYLMMTPKENSEGFLFKTKLYEEPTWYIYLTCLHMGGGNLCSYNYTEFKDADFPDKLTRCVLLLLGMSYFLYVTVIVLQLVSSSAEPELKYQSIMHGVKDYIRNKKLPTKLKERLLHFYEHRFQGSLFKEKAITSTLCKHLKNQITQQSSRILLESTPLFTNISRTTLTNIIGALKQVIFLQDDVIYKCDSTGKCMYFIVTGTVAMISYSGKEVFNYYLIIIFAQRIHRLIIFFTR